MSNLELHAALLNLAKKAVDRIKNNPKLSDHLLPSELESSPAQRTTQESK